MAITRIGPNQSINLASNITGTLPTGNGGTGATSFAPGKILQVSSLVQTSSPQTIGSSSYVDLTGVTVNITPSATSSKILIMANLAGRLANDRGYGMQFVRGSTSVYATLQNYSVYAQSGGEMYTFAHFEYIDSPSSTSELTYKVQIRTGSGNSMTWNNATNSNIFLMEISG